EFRWGMPFATEIREPLYVWIQHLTLRILGPNDFQFMLVTVLASLATVCAAYWLCKKLSGKSSVALLAALFVACNHFAVHVSVLGERTDLFNLLILLFCLVLIWPDLPDWASEVLLGIL